MENDANIYGSKEKKFEDILKNIKIYLMKLMENYQKMKISKRLC